MDEDLRDEDYRTLADIRHALRRFTRFSEEAAAAAGVTPQQHQALLAIRAEGGHMLVGTLAERLLLRPHSATGQIDRLVRQDLVRRDSGTEDRRQVSVSLTGRGTALLASLSAAHRAELRRLRPLLRQLIERV
jgi:DNA-binding MarR family transcriptional regulator